MTLPFIRPVTMFKGIPIYVDEEACAAFGCACFAVYVAPGSTIVKEFYATEAVVEKLRKVLDETPPPMVGTPLSMDAL